MGKYTAQKIDLWMFKQLLQQTVHNPLPTAPSDVIARHAIAIAIITAFRPLHHRKKANTVALQPIINLATIALAISLSPALRPLTIRLKLRRLLPIPPK